jgi:hypothetical protein
MKTYRLNCVLDGTDNLVCPYSNKRDLKRNWKNDLKDYFKEHGFDPASNEDWYPYFTLEGSHGDIQDLTYNKVFGGAAL